MKFALIFLISFCALAVQAQQVLKGVVLDAEKGTPVPAASVFLNNTSVGTTTNAQGDFTLTLPYGRFDLIVSSIGYETSNTTITASEAAATLTIRLQPKAQELATVIVEPYEVNGWEKWGRFFTENFIGTSAQAKECKIKNSSIIKFRHSKKDGELTAYAAEPLVVENKALGYTLKYQMESFSYSFKTGYLQYQGYPFFEPMKGSAARQKRWQEKRQAVYAGSMLHFMRSVYRNNLAAEGFEVRSLQKIKNTEKERVAEVYGKRARKVVASAGTITVSAADSALKDSSEYYSTVMRQPDYFDKIGSTILPGDSIAYAVNNTTAGLYFDDYLLVIYKKALAPPEYRQFSPQNGTSMMSQLQLQSGQPVEIGANGSYYNPLDLLSLGYWAWSEKLSTMLPFDFEPSPKAPAKQ